MAEEVTVTFIGYKVSCRKYDSRLTVGDVKHDLILSDAFLGELSFDRLHLSYYPYESLPNDSTLQSLLPKKWSWFSKKKGLCLRLYVTISKSVAASLPAKPDLDRTTTPTPTLPPKLVKIFQGESQFVVDGLVTVTGHGRDLMLSFYSHSLSETTSNMEAAEHFFLTMCQNGLEGCFYKEENSPNQVADFDTSEAVWNPNSDNEDDRKAPAKQLFLPGTNCQRVTNVDGALEGFFCPVCDEDRPFWSCFVMDCADQHLICYDCIEGYLEEEAKSGVASIQCFMPLCNHEMTPAELARAIGRGNASYGRQHPIYAKIDQRKLDNFIEENGEDFCTCPGQNCRWTVARSSWGVMEKVTCDICKTTFCSNCRRDYHYRTKCYEFEHLRREWRDWEACGRAEYWRTNKEMHEKAKEIEKEKKRLLEVTQAEIEDEKRKEALCRHCPHCGRIVERLSGCNIMRCGYDPDTKSNLQSGCHKRFDWDKARPYKAAKPITRAKIPASQASNKTVHQGWNCDLCHEEIQGLRFECILCPSFYICEGCDNSSSLAHTEGHFFRIHQSG